MGLKAAVIPVTAFQQNCSLLWDEDTGKGVVVDPGGDVDRIMSAVAETGATVERILLTHGHMDHAGGAAELRDALAEGRPAPPPIIGPDERDRFLLEGLAEQAARFGIEGARDVLPDRWLSEGDEVEIAGVPFSVLHCPGHTPGHVVFVSAALRFALVGDVLFQGSVGRTDLPGGDHATLMASIAGLLGAYPDETKVFPGHMGITALGTERATNPFLRELARP